jgi:hypothetical protein
MSNPFHYIASITHQKNDMMTDEDGEKGYSPFMTNRGLSYFQDTVLLANEMNRMSHLDNKLQYDFLRHAVRSKKRFSKWAKKSTSDDIEIIKEYYGYTDEKAYAVVDLISDATLAEMKQRISKGGKTK